MSDRRSDGVTLRRLEEAAFAAWPAEEVVVFEGWRLRYMSGVTRRGNSVWPNECEGSATLEERLGIVERFYAERLQPALFQVGPLSCPSGLDAWLETKGYSVDAPVSIQTAPIEVLDRLEVAPGFDVDVTTQPSPAFLELLGPRGRFAQSMDVFRRLLGRIGSRGGYGVAWYAGEPVSAGLVVSAAALAGVFAMRTREGYRGRGAGRALLLGLLQHARACGASAAYLQVERDNPAALALYRRAGFAEAYGYHYRRAPR